MSEKTIRCKYCGKEPKYFSKGKGICELCWSNIRKADYVSCITDCEPINQTKKAFVKRMEKILVKQEKYTNWNMLECFTKKRERRKVN
jgi:hypothetical protein